MKKWIVILICAFMWSQDCNEINFMLGDINNDGNSTVFDLEIIA